MCIYYNRYLHNIPVINKDAILIFVAVTFSFSKNETFVKEDDDVVQICIEKKGNHDFPINVTIYLCEDQTTTATNLLPATGKLYIVFKYVHEELNLFFIRTYLRVIYIKKAHIYLLPYEICTYKK